MRRDDPWARPLDRFLLTVRHEFGHDTVRAVLDEDRAKYGAEYWRSICPLHPSDTRPLVVRERRGPGSSLWLTCASDCLPSVIQHKVRLLEAWHLELRKKRA